MLLGVLKKYLNLNDELRQIKTSVLHDIAFKFTNLIKCINTKIHQKN